ncbi:hypothetical protein QTO34_007170 [Cnephaeus nilssonii]|uniref:COX assembly mitochondrial protein n=1 Tax=Cnephaeus nilssonii TaxID=3371016 RepID=A0AA40LGC7_CNENI|nr:hypothetical protein QTO34_007170 [Eptesicus nilssonii]
MGRVTQILSVLWKLHLVKEGNSVHTGSEPGEGKRSHRENEGGVPRSRRENEGHQLSELVQNFTKCCKESGILMVVKCRKENSALKECLTAYYTDPAFYEECKMEYLKEREEFRKTGIPTKKRLQKLPTSM